MDRHVVEPPGIWEQHLEAPYKGRAPRMLGSHPVATEVLGTPMVSGGPELLPSLEPAGHFTDARASGFSPQATLRDMDREGVDVAVLLPGAGLYAVWGDHLDAPLAAALCRAYNTWMADYCRASPGRLKGVALLPLQGVIEAVGELRRAVEELGMVGALVRPNPVLRRQLDAREYWPLYQEVQRLGVPLWVHGGPGSILPEIGVRDVTGLEWPQGVVRFQGSFTRHAISHPLEIMGAVISLAGEEPFMEFPDLKVVFAGAGCGWLPFWAERMDDEYFHRGEDAVTRLKPGVYLRRQGFVCARAHEALLPEAAEEHQGLLVWGSEYPFPELSDFPDELDPLVQNPRLSDDAKRDILWGNAARLLKLS
jgi:predicted TIM-barrel fold metal-dependent hydrolase